MKILISDPLSEEGVRIFRDEKSFQVDVKTDLKPEDLKKIIGGYDCLIVRSATKVTKDVIEAAKSLKIIGRAGVGLDNVDLPAATARGIIVMNSPGGNTISTAEHTFSMLLALSRNIPQASQSMKLGEWKRSKFMGVEVYGKTLGIVGLGRIGTEVAKRAISFGMKIIAYDPFLSEEKLKALDIVGGTLEKIFELSDYITVHTPMTDETYHMISEKQFDKMKPGVRLINCARGGIIDETALVKAIEAGKVAGAAFDVFEKEPLKKEHPLLKCDKVILTPHLGASTQEAQINVSIEIAECVRDALLNKGIRNAANFPSLEQERFKALLPWTNLCEKIGLLGGQLIESGIEELTINFNGFFTASDVAPLSMALVRGILTPILQDTVNFINAITLAKERGIKIIEKRSSDEEEFVNLITAEIKTKAGIKVIAGTLFADKNPRIVKIDSAYVEAIPQGYMLVLNNQDKPGIIGALGILLGEHGINIAGMTFGRESVGGKATSVLNIDSAVSTEILEKIKKLKNILWVNSIKL